MIKIGISSILLAGLLIGEAGAQEATAPLAKGTCAVFGKLVAAASDHFQPYRGAAISPGVYGVTIAISGFQSCSVLSNGPDMYFCNRTANNTFEARALYQDALQKIRPCFPDWREAPAVAVPAPGLEMIEARRLIETVADGEITVGIMHSRDSRKAPSVEIVSVAVMMQRKGDRPAP